MHRPFFAKHNERCAFLRHAHHIRPPSDYKILCFDRVRQLKTATGLAKPRYPGVHCSRYFSVSVSRDYTGYLSRGSFFYLRRQRSLFPREFLGNRSETPSPILYALKRVLARTNLGWKILSIVVGTNIIVFHSRRVSTLRNFRTPFNLASDISSSRERPRPSAVQPTINFEVSTLRRT